MKSPVEDGTAEIQRLQGCINNLISLLALPAMWSGHESRQIISTLLDGVVGMLRLDFAYARVSDSMDGSATESIRLAERRDPAVQPQEVGRALDQWLTGGVCPSHVVAPNPLGEGEVSIAFFRLGLQQEIGLFVAVSERADFPTEIERLLLRVAANQTAIGLQEARRMGERRRAAVELERRVEERTSQLTAVNEELRNEIDRRKRVEEEQRTLASLVENSTDLIGLASLEGQVLFINPAGQKMLGLEGDEQVRGTRILDYVVEEDREAFQVKVLPVALSDGQWEGETRFRHFKTARPIPMLQHIFSIKEVGSDRPVALATISRDITRRKETEQELLALKDELAAELAAMTRLHEVSTRLLASTELQPLLEEVLNATIGLQNADFGNVQLYNPETQALEIVAQRGFQSDFLDYFSALNEDSAACGRALHRQERVIIEDVETDPGFEPYRAIAASAGFRAVQFTPLFGRSGEPLGMMSTHFRQPHRPSERELRLTDLYARQAAETLERKRVEAVVRRGEAYLAEGQRISHTGSWAWNVSTGDLFWSEEHFRIFGLDPEKVKPTYPLLLQWIHRDDRIILQQTFDEAVRKKSDYQFEFRILRPDGVMRYVLTRAHPAFNEAGDLIEYIGTIIDITDRKRAEEALAKAQAELAHASRVMTLGEITASIAHEVNQPLGAIVTNGNASLRLLSRDHPDIPEAREALGSIINDAMRASEVIKRIRALLKKSGVEKTLVSINETIREVVAMAGGELARNQVSVRMELDGDLPPLFGDRVQLQQVLLNLILNGSEAMSGGGSQTPELLITSQRSESDGVVVAVQDSGTGLKPEDCERIFDAFFTTREGGLGLGLSISRTIIEAHGGRLWAMPGDGKGTTLRFTLPAASESRS